MKAQRFTVLILLGFLCLTLALGAKKGTEKKARAVSLTDAIGIKNIVTATIIHSPNGFSSQEGRTACYVSDRKKLASLLSLLSDFPSKGGRFKSWPEDISHWTLYIHGSNDKVIALSIYGYSLQSPVDGSFSPSANDPQNRKLMKLLGKMLEPKKKANKRGKLAVAYAPAT